MSRSEPYRILSSKYLPLILLTQMLLSCGPTDSPNVTVFAAASTSNALGEIGEIFTEKTGIAIVFSFASSSMLAKQIEKGAPAHIYVSANSNWMDYLEERNQISPGSRDDFLGNQLVLIRPVGDPAEQVTTVQGPDLLARVGDGRLALGDPDHVPAGIYAKECLKFLEIWDPLEPRLARAMDVRAALALVERKEAPLGVVYSTDARISERVQVVATFSSNCHSPITYSVAQIQGNETPDAKAFMQFLKSDLAASIFKKNGFTVR